MATFKSFKSFDEIRAENRGILAFCLADSRQNAMFSMRWEWGWKPSGVFYKEYFRKYRYTNLYFDPIQQLHVLPAAGCAAVAYADSVVYFGSGASVLEGFDSWFNEYVEAI